MKKKYVLFNNFFKIKTKSKNNSRKYFKITKTSLRMSWLLTWRIMSAQVLAHYVGAGLGAICRRMSRLTTRRSHLGSSKSAHVLAQYVGACLGACLGLQLGAAISARPFRRMPRLTTGRGKMSRKCKI